MGIQHGVLVAAFMFGISAGGSVMAGAFEDALAAAGRGDYATALRLWQPLAEQGSPSAQNNLGYMYQRGEGVRSSPVDAFKWWRLAAASGFADAQNNVGISYADGYGVEQEHREAVKWYRLAAEQGHPSAQSNLGASYGAGWGVAQDWVESRKWYRLSAEQGDAFGQSNLGVAYANGQGVAQDFVQAYMWYTLAASTFTYREDRVGLERALSNRARVARVMTPAQISAGQELATGWKPKKK